MASGVPSIGEDGVLSEGRPLPINCLPVEVGIRRQVVEYTCIDASQQFLVVGSAQGYVWVIDLLSSRLLREFNECKGSAITVVKLNPVRDYIAYGTENGFIRVERISKVMSNKLRVQERSGQRVSCIEWGQNGADIFCGFDSGRLVQFNVKFKDDVMKHVQLYPDNYGSAVVQLSVSANSLLVSTMDRAFLLDINTNKLSQVGRKERKSGGYGGCFIESGGAVLLARPGLRIWIADEFGKVLSTMAFKEALSSQRLPAVPVHSVSTSHATFSRSWQFSTLHAMLEGKFMVSFHENTLFVLDAMNGVIVGAVAFKENIKSISTSGGFLYILTSVASKGTVIVRVAVHYSFVTAESEPWKSPSSATTSVNNSPVGTPMGSSECLIRDMEKSPARVMTKPMRDEREQDGLLVEKPPVQQPRVDPSASSHVGPPTILVSVEGETVTYVHHQEVGETQSASSKANSEDLKPQDDTVVISCESIQKADTIDLLQPTLLSATEQIQAEAKEQKVPEWNNLFTKVDDTNEQSRRVRMSQAVDDEIVADSKSHRKKRKKLKGKKLSSAGSSRSVSMERLADVAEEQDALAQVCSTPLHPQDVSELLGDLEVEAGTTLIESGTTPIDADRPKEIADKVLENFLDDDVHVPLPTVNITEERSGQQVVASGKQVIENESGQQFSTETLVYEGDEPELGIRGRDAALDQVEEVASSCNKEQMVDITNSLDIPVGNSSSSSTKCGMDAAGEVSDDPLYNDSDEEQSLGNEENVNLLDEEPVQFQHSVLQPAFSDPLQDEETLETGTASRLAPVHEVFPDAVYSEDNSDSKVYRHVTSWIDISESDTCYIRDQNFDVSDSSHDSEPESTTAADAASDSQVADDFYQLCGDLVKNTTDQNEEPAPLTSHNQFSQASISNSNSLNQASRLCEAQEGEAKEDEASEGQSMDIWVSVPLPSRHSLQCVSLSDVLLWAVDSRGHVFCTTTSSRGKSWQPLKKTMQQISSSSEGHVVWSIYHQNAYVRLGIGMNPAGTTWKNVTKNSSLAHKIKHLAVEDNGVWAITVDNRVLFRKGVDERNPEGKVWQEVAYGMNFSFISYCKNIVWALSNIGKVFIRDGITPSSPSGKKWTEIKSPYMMAVSLTVDGIVWGVNNEGSVGFRTGINSGKPGGRGPWWEVTINSELQGISPLNSLWQVMGADGGHLLSSAVGSHISSAVSSLVSLPHQNQVTTVSASKAGVVVLEAGHRLHGCWKMATGYHYTPACKEGIFQFNMWSRVAAGGTSLWFVRNDGDLYCLSPGSKLKRVEVPSNVELIAASPNCMWVISKDMVWSRQGMTPELPEGISFDYIELSTLLHDKKLRSVACGKKVAWGIDSSGVPHFRFGVHAREPGTGMSPAWVPVEDHPGPLLQIAVSPNDWLVWACDESHSVYVRSGVTVDFPVGRKWVKILKQKLKELAATSDRIYGLTPSGELVCRYGISENNVQGSFWRKLPGKYEHITTGAFGELWTLDNKGQVWKQEWKVIQVSDMQFNFDGSTMTDPESWEFL